MAVARLWRRGGLVAPVAAVALPLALGLAPGAWRASGEGLRPGLFQKQFAARVSVPLFRAALRGGWLYAAASRSPVCTGLWWGGAIVTAGHCGLVGVPMAGRAAGELLGPPGGAPTSAPSGDVQAWRLPESSPALVRWRTDAPRPGEVMVVVCRAPSTRVIVGEVEGAGDMLRISNPGRVAAFGCDGAPVVDRSSAVAGMVDAYLSATGDLLAVPAPRVLAALRALGIIR